MGSSFTDRLVQGSSRPKSHREKQRQSVAEHYSGQKMSALLNDERST